MFVQARIRTDADAMSSIPEHDARRLMMMLSYALRICSLCVYIYFRHIRVCDGGWICSLLLER